MHNGPLQFFGLCLLLSTSLGASTVPLSWQSVLKPAEVPAHPAEVEETSDVESQKPEKRSENPAIQKELNLEKADLKPGILNTTDLLKYTLTPDAILTALQDEVIAHFHLEGELQLYPSERLEKSEVPDANWYVELVAPYPTALNSRMALRYRFTNGLEAQETQLVTVRAEWWRDAIIALRQMRPGELDGESHTQIKRVNWLLYRGDLVEAETPLNSLALNSLWRSNEPLRWSQVKARPMVESGAVVDVVASEGTLKITMRGVATESGNAGDLIKVRNLQSQKEIQGVISNANTVLVVF